VADMSPCPQRIMQSVSSGQSGAAFGSSAVQYLPAAFGCHTRAEPVGSFALDDAWLKCSFHIKSRKIPNVYSCIRSRPGHGLTCLPWRGLFCSISGYSCFIYIGMHISASVPIYIWQQPFLPIPTYSYLFLPIPTYSYLFQPVPISPDQVPGTQPACIFLGT
jgi:hypothetical protein